MATSWLEAFRRQRVTVMTFSGDEERSDTGTLLEMGDGWVQIEKTNGEMLLIPYTAIRIVKLLDMTQMAPAYEADAGVRGIDTHVYERNAQSF